MGPLCGVFQSIVWSVFLLRPWWRHQMETNSALLALCAENSPVPGEFPAQRPVTRSFDVYFDLRPNKRLSKQSWGWWLETISCSLWRHCNVIAVLYALSCCIWSCFDKIRMYPEYTAHTSSDMVMFRVFREWHCSFILLFLWRIYNRIILDHDLTNVDCTRWLMKIDSQTLVKSLYDIQGIQVLCYIM